MPAEFDQLVWDESVAEDCRRLIRLAVDEDLSNEQDWTTVALTPESRRGCAQIVAREPGVAAGMPALAAIIDDMQLDLEVTPAAVDGASFAAGAELASLSGSVRDLLTGERTILNLIGRLIGVATLTRQFVEQVESTGAQIYDTRKTTPGWRRLEKYAVRCGGGCNHRLGLFDAVLIKDNHLAQLPFDGPENQRTAAAMRAIRQFMCEFEGGLLADRTLEIEVDRLDQLRAVLPEQPDIVLLDNMSLAELRESVTLRGAVAPAVQLEASGGVSLQTVREIAQTGVDRISVGSLTHAARAIDIGLDWVK